VRILFVTSTRLGDAVLSTGVLGRLLDEIGPAARPTVVCGAPAASIFAAVPGLERLIVLNKRRYSLHWAWLWRQVAGRRWDVVVDLRNAPLMRLLWAARRIHLPPARGREHQVARLGRALGAAPPPPPRLWLSEAHRRLAAELIPDGPPALAVAPVANWMGKTWPAEYFIELARRLTGPEGPLPGGRVAVLGAPSERAAAAPLLDALAGDRLIDLVGRTDPAQAGACIARAALFVGNDSGLMHVAAAAGVPTLGLFGPSPEWLYAPWGPHTAIVRTPQSYDELMRDLDVPLSHRRSLMYDLTVDDACAAAVALYRQRG